ncbi:MAG: hypothetical protein QM530_02325, partial [Phycisphaerales bacterium]|nr:hypothetical protein [Phycisphaerales bacterium]
MEAKQSRIDAIINETKSSEDWTAVIIPEAMIEDLDIAAISKARTEYKKRNPKYAEDVDHARLTGKYNDGKTDHPQLSLIVLYLLHETIR